MQPYRRPADPELPSCKACGQAIAAQLDRGHPQYDPAVLDNALEIEFDGGYGYFIDPWDQDHPYKAIICHACAHELCERVLWINQLIDPLRSHAHRPDRVPAGHQGWDLSPDGSSCALQ